METVKEEFEKICAFAQDKKDAIDAERNDAMVNRICQLLTAAVQNGEENDEMLHRRADELVNDAYAAWREVECVNDGGDYAAHLFAMLREQVEKGRVAGVRLDGDDFAVAR